MKCTSKLASVSSQSSFITCIQSKCLEWIQFLVFRSKDSLDEFTVGNSEGACCCIRVWYELLKKKLGVKTEVKRCLSVAAVALLNGCAGGVLTPQTVAPYAV